MKSMSCLCLVTLLVSVTCTSAFAGCGVARRHTGADARSAARNLDPERLAHEQTAMMAEQLELDGAQIAQVNEINLRYAHRIKSIADSDTSRRSRVSQMRDLADEKDAELARVLSPSQYDRYQELKNKFRDMIRNRLRGRG